MANVVDQCGEGCGWAAALIAALAYGSFGVFVRNTKHIDVHPLVLQSYKTFVFFLTSWFVTLSPGVGTSFTKWGLLSGLLWVVGGTGGVYGIRAAGMAVAVGTWASIMIIVNFVFGILIFQEPVYDLLGTAASFLLLIVGLVGMSKYAAPPKNQSKASPSAASTAATVDDKIEALSDAPLEDSFMDNQTMMDDGAVQSDDDSDDASTYFVLFGICPLTKWQCGVLGAVANGVFTGSSLIPLHYAKDEGYGGANYVISMASGSFVSNVLLWICLLAYNAIVHKAHTVWEALETMPSWHFRQLWRPGFSAGILLSVAMFGSIIAVTYLGQGVGNSLVQTKILIGGLWGIFYHKEIRGTRTIAMWFVSAGIAVVAIIWLSMVRLLAKNG